VRRRVLRPEVDRVVLDFCHLGSALSLSCRT
jgi:hypothetical protein